jgi:serpin B
MPVLDGAETRSTKVARSGTDGMVSSSEIRMKRSSEHHRIRRAPTVAFATIALLSAVTAASSARADAQPGVAAQTSAAQISAGAVNAFGADLLAAELTRAPQANVAVSPWNVDMALAMLRAGARGQTAAEMDRVLHVTDPAAAPTQARALERELAGREQTVEVNGRRSSVQFAPADRVFTQHDLALVPAFVEQLGTQFGATIGKVDYRHAPDRARSTIDDWVSTRTHGSIPQLLAPGSLDASTRVVLVSALYLHADWRTPFEKGFTASGRFHAPTKQVTAQFMSSDRETGYAAGPDWQAVELPYVGKQLVLDVIVPTAGNAQDAAEVVSAFVTHPPHFTDSSVSLTIPKFHLHTTFSLGRVLTDLGMRSVFGNQADFSGLTTATPVTVAKVIHQADISVDEQGTTAAAATAVDGKSGDALPQHDVTADHPFFYVLRDRPTGVVIFAGEVNDPTAH